jgi:predicted lipoprotein with Yx(FWY)xxD motif
MRTLFITFAVITIGALGAGSAQSAEAEPDNTEHPGVVALSHEDGKWLYRKFPASTRLYVRAADLPGKSTCDTECAFAWPPLLAEGQDTGSIGDWTTLVREDGRRQWAYKEQPVYMRFHDSVESPIGNSVEGWQFLTP